MMRWSDPEACGAAEPSDRDDGVQSRVRVVTRGLAVILVAMAVAVVYLADQPQPDLGFATSCEGVRGSVRAQSFAPGGRMMYACTADGSLLIWTPGWPLRRVDLVDALVMSRRTAFAPNLLTLAVSSRDGGVSLWDLGPCRRRFQIPMRFGPVLALAFSPDSATLALADETGVRLLDVERGLPRVGPELNVGGVTCVAFAPDGRTLAVGGEDGRLRVWDPSDTVPSTTFRAHKSNVTSLVFADGGRVMASASHDDHVVRLWEVTGGRLLAEFEACSQVQAMTFAPGSRHLAAAGLDGAVRVWDTAAPAACRVIQEHDGPVSSLAFSPDCESLACGGSGSIRLYRIDTISTSTNR